MRVTRRPKAQETKRAKTNGDRSSARFTGSLGLLVAWSLNPVDLTSYRTFMQELARESGDFIRPFFGRADLAVEAKADQTPVTAADRGAEELLRARIARKYPAHGIVGEEFGSERADAEWVWILDPIDGTKSFISGVPLWGTLIALAYRGQPVLGCINQPVLGQLMIGDGTTTTLNGRIVRVRPCARLADATLLTSDPISPALHKNGPAFDHLLRSVRLARTWGDCYGYLLLASGRADVMLDPIMNTWDIAALVPIVRGAGGIISDWDGGPTYPATSTVASGSAELHATILRALASP
jgi:histidinol phosphatase-like enzyme (inositol monophosphatase family)